MGALGYEPDYSETGFDKSALDLNKLSEEASKILKGEASDTLEELYNLGGSSAGARPKVLIGYNPTNDKVILGQQDLQDRYEHWMVKFGASIDEKDIGNIEYAYSLMAKAAGIEMPETRLFKGENNKYWFGIKRFDRIGNTRVHMHSVAGLIHSDHRTPILDYDTLFRCALVLNPNIQEVTKLFRLACFNVFAHNRDDHSKNFSFLMNSKGTWRFAPAYDLTYSSGPGGEHSAMVNGEGKNPTSSNLLDLAKKFSIKNAEIIIDEVKESVSKWKDFANEAGVSKTSKDSIKKVIDKLIKI